MAPGGTKRLLALCLFVLAGIAALMPVPVLDVRVAQSGQPVWCAAAAAYPLAPLTVRYESRNSIWDVQAVETWAVEGGITIRQVRSVPIVLEYYGISEYQMQADGTATGAPVVARYPSVRIEASPRGAQRLTTDDATLDISRQFAEGAILVAEAAWRPRAAACRLM